MRAISFSIDRAAVQERAYFIWEARGRPPGSSLADWLQAERDAVAELVAKCCNESIEIRLDEKRQDAAFALADFDGAWRVRRSWGLVELSLPEQGNLVRRYGLVELECKGDGGGCARYGLVELGGRRRDRRRYGLIELPARSPECGQ